jgi:hypothetical protein
MQGKKNNYCRPIMHGAMKTCQWQKKINKLIISDALCPW